MSLKLPIFMNKKLIIVLIVIVVIMCAGIIPLMNSNTVNFSSIDINDSVHDNRGSIIVDAKSLNETNGEYHTDSNEVNCILVKNKGNLQLTKSVAYKSGTARQPSDEAKNLGLNSAILVNSNSTLDLSSVEITTNYETSSGLYVSNADSSADNSQQTNQSTVKGTSEANIKYVKITTNYDDSKGVVAAFDGKITADSLDINTNGKDSPAIATGPGKGKIYVKNSEINTDYGKNDGTGSPLIYSTGNITAENTKGTAYASQIAYLDGLNSIELVNCDLTGYGANNKQDNSTHDDLGGVFIYQSAERDDNGTALFKAKNSKLSISSDSSQYKKAPMFHVTNTNCEIDLENSEFNFGSDKFLEVSKQNQWGTNGSNGGSVKLNTANEKIDGKVIVDKASSLNWTMKDTEFKGSIKSTGNTTVNIPNGSSWKLTKDSTVSNLTLSGEIDYGNFTLIVGGKTYNSSNPFKG